MDDRVQETGKYIEGYALRAVARIRRSVEKIPGRRPLSRGEHVGLSFRQEAHRQGGQAAEGQAEVVRPGKGGAQGLP